MEASFGINSPSEDGMEVWNREELYREVWEQPQVKVASKYGISAVRLGKVCRKLQIPLPGRGYWVKKEFGKPVQQASLPDVEDLPVVMRYDDEEKTQPSSEQRSAQESGPTDEYLKAILAMENRIIPFTPSAKRHKFVTTAGRVLAKAKPNSYGILEWPWNEPRCLDIRVTKPSLERALNLANFLVEALEEARFPVTFDEASRACAALIFGQRVRFAIAERSTEIGRKEVKEYSSTRTVIEYAGSGTLEFRAGDYGYGQKIRDRKKQKLEDLIALCIGALMREARKHILWEAERKQAELERQEKARVRAELSAQIAAEEKRLQELNAWVDNWSRARVMRDFILEVEKLWGKENHDLSADSDHGKRLSWMRQQADRLDPTLPSPPSILDRKAELNSWY
jgi:hypothetical protein